MNGVKQKRLVTSVAKLAARCCSYIGGRCDCKFMSDSMLEGEEVGHGESGNGCPELMMATYLLAAMTEQEFNAISKRAGITISEDQDEKIDATAILRQQKALRDEQLMPSQKEKKPKSKTEVKVWTKRKSVYDLSNSKKAIKAMMPSAPASRSTRYSCDTCGASYVREDNLAFHQCPKK